ncbi:hypothetical protein R7V75_03105 [Mesomycoplasma ovipneumoniae]|uniref:Lipoprotein n=1 Tax=Mesomycoplasma ovipneumoniae TaxID=29562 RepID=A0AAJ2P735_9BACT|nr:hypothetical protein [Mesomycoplasma ovipneumoniae]MDW2893065.1 hypothetical protein [Mesomycoplasma ovipneumoniae]MDW2908701.1 hypothetical protein [Mesomycoplasma ovipneumoniae]
MKWKFKKSLALIPLSFPLVVVSCIENQGQDVKNPEKYNLLTEILNMPLPIETQEIANTAFADVIHAFSSELDFQNFIPNEPDDVIKKKLEKLAKTPNFPEIVKKYYQGTSYLTASEFLQRWKQSQEKYLKSVDFKAYPEFLPENFGSGIAVNNLELREEYLYYKVIQELAKLTIKKKREEEAKSQNQHSGRKDENKTQEDELIAVGFAWIKFIVESIEAATRQPVSNSFWWNYNYKILNRLNKSIQDTFEANLDLPILNDKDYQKKVELTEKLEKYSITGKDGRKYKVQPRAFFLNDQKTHADESTNTIKDAIYRIYWIIDQNPDTPEDKSQSENQSQNQNEPKSTSQKNLINQKPSLFSQNSSQKVVTFQQNSPSPVQGPQTREEAEAQQIGLIDDFDKYKLTDKIEKYPFVNSNNFHRGGLYSATLLELEDEIKKQDPKNPKIFYVERRINISGFLKSGNLLPFQPIDLEQNLKKLSQTEKYVQFVRALRPVGSRTNQLVIVNPKNIDKD